MKSMLTHPLRPLEIQTIEMQDWSRGYPEDADPVHRIILDGICGDWPSETAARAFAAAIDRRASAAAAQAARRDIDALLDMIDDLLVKGQEALGPDQAEALKRITESRKDPSPSDAPQRGEGHLPAPIDLQDDEKDALIRWALGRTTGASAQAIACNLLGLGTSSEAPHDASDFERCERLLNEVPELRRRLPEMASVSPQWKALVASWDVIAASGPNLRRRLISDAVWKIPG